MSVNSYAAQLPVTDRQVVVAGGGPSMIGHVARLVAAGARVRVVASRCEAAIEDLAHRGTLRWVERDWQPGDLDEAWLVVADVDDAPLADECEARRVWRIPVDPAAMASDPNVTSGHVTLVGGGPGDPGLLTVAGKAALQSADVVVADRLAPLGALVDLPNSPQIIDVSKIPGGRRTSQEQINALLVEHALRGRHVVRLKGGDSFVFGRGGEEVIACADAGIAVQVIPGVTSAVAAPELLGVPVTHRGLSQGFTVVSGHLPPGHPGSTVDYAALAQCGTTLVLLMAVANLEAIAAALVDGGLPASTPCVVISDAAMASQRSVRSKLDAVAADARSAGVGAPAVTVVGEVAGLTDVLAP